MKTVHKYHLEEQSRQMLSLPQGAIVRGVGEQHGRIKLWAEVDPDAPVVNRQVLIFGTGHPMAPRSDDFEFLGTVIASGGALVWHVYMQAEA